MDKENKGALFKNKDKTKETQPDLTGNINIDGKDYQLSAWKNVSKESGKTYLSLRINNKKEFKKEENTDFLNDDIPF